MTAARGVVQSTVSGTGSLEPATRYDLDFQTSGTVTEVLVEAGDKVVAGQTLARLDQRSARVQLAQARADYEAAEDALESATPTDASTPADAAVLQTVSLAAAPGEAVASPDPEGEVPEDEEDTSPPEGTDPPDDQDQDSDPAPDPDAETEAPSETSPTTVAPSTGDSASGTATAISEAEAEADLQSANLSVVEAEQALMDTVLRAPASGTIAEVVGAVGDATGGSSSDTTPSDSAETDTGAATDLGAPTAADSSDSSDSTSTTSGFLTLVQLGRLNLDVTFSESDIGKLKVGQAATVTVNALPDVELAARVTSIGTLSESSGSVVEYPVTLSVEQRDHRLKPGMTASVDVVVSQVGGAVNVPSQAISQGPGGATVTVSVDGGEEDRTVTTGVEGESTTQITSGLKAGDRVVITTNAVSGASPEGAGSVGGGGFPGGGGGGFPGGGGPPGGGFPGGGGGPP